MIYKQKFNIFHKISSCSSFRLNLGKIKMKGAFLCTCSNTEKCPYHVGMHSSIYFFTSSFVNINIFFLS